MWIRFNNFKKKILKEDKNSYLFDIWLITSLKLELYTFFNIYLNTLRIGFIHHWYEKMELF